MPPAGTAGSAAAPTRFGAPVSDRQQTGRSRAAAMTARDRQRLHLVLTRVEQERQAQPGTIHKVVYGFMGNKTTVEVIYDDGRQEAERGAGTRTPQPHVAACPAAAHGRGQQRATCPPQPARREQGKAGAAAGRSPEEQKKADDEADERARTEYTAAQLRDMVNNMSKAKAKAIERAVKAIITSVVREMGGDERTGGDLLDIIPRTLRLGAHSIVLRLPLRCLAGEHVDDELEDYILEKYFSYHFNPERGALILRSVLMPLDRMTTSPS